MASLPNLSGLPLRPRSELRPGIETPSGIYCLDTADKLTPCTARVILYRKAVPLLLKMGTGMPTLKALVYTDALCTVDECQTKVGGAGKLRVYSLAEVIELGKAHLCPPTPYI